MGFVTGCFVGWTVAFLLVWAYHKFPDPYDRDRHLVFDEPPRGFQSDTDHGG